MLGGGAILFAAFCAGAPAPRTELHVHLDGAISFATLWDIAAARGLALPGGVRDAAGLARYCSAHGPGEAFSFRWFACVLDIVAGDAASVELAAERFVDWQQRSGVGYTEVRYAPQLLAASARYNASITADEAVAAVTRGLRRGLARHGHRLRVHQILCAYRELPPARCDEVAELAAGWASEDRSLPATVVGMDLAGNETAHPNPLFFPCFRRARALSVRNITVHAGEFPGVPAQSVWEAVEVMGARRIGHGYAAARNASVAALLRRRSVHLEVCPSTCVSEYHANHSGCPAAHFPSAGLADLSVSTDDPALWNTTAGREYALARDLGLDPDAGAAAAYRARFGP